jgi:hypothetical protein
MSTPRRSGWSLHGAEPVARRGDNSDKTIKAIRENLRHAFGDFARSVKIPVH